MLIPREIFHNVLATFVESSAAFGEKWWSLDFSLNCSLARRLRQDEPEPLHWIALFFIIKYPFHLYERVCESLCGWMRVGRSRKSRMIYKQKKSRPIRLSLDTWRNWQTWSDSRSLSMEFNPISWWWCAHSPHFFSSFPFFFCFFLHSNVSASVKWKNHELLRSAIFMIFHISPLSRMGTHLLLTILLAVVHFSFHAHFVQHIMGEVGISL